MRTNAKYSFCIYDMFTMNLDETDTKYSQADCVLWLCFLTLALICVFNLSICFRERRTQCKYQTNLMKQGYGDQL